MTGSPEVPTPPRSFALTLPQLWVFLAVALPVVAALVAAMSTADLAYGIRAGQLMLDRGEILRADPFTFTAAGRPWLDQQWGAQIVLAAVYGAGGWALLAAFRALLVGVLFALVYRSCRGAGAGMRGSAWLTLVAFGVSAVALALRAQLCGMVLFALTTWLVVGRRRHPRLAWAIPAVVLLWANVHGSFFLGPAIVGFAWLENRRRGGPGSDRLLVIAALSAAATLVNPWGLGVWTYAVGLTASPTIRSLLAEWQVTSPLTFVGAVFYASLFAVGVAVAVALRRRSGSVPWSSLLWLGLLAGIGLYAQRGVAWWALGAPMAVAGLLGGRPTAVSSGAIRPERRSAANLAIAGAVLALGVLALPWWRAGTPADGSLPLIADAPSGVTVAIQARATPSDRIFAPQPLGSWLELALVATPVFVDSRVEIFETRVWDDYLAVATGGDASLGILDRWKVTLVATTPDSLVSLTARMRSDPAWRVLYDGDDGTVFARR